MPKSPCMTQCNQSILQNRAQCKKGAKDKKSWQACNVKFNLANANATCRTQCNEKAPPGVNPNAPTPNVRK